MFISKLFTDRKKSVKVFIGVLGYEEPRFELNPLHSSELLNRVMTIKLHYKCKPLVAIVCSREPTDLLKSTFDPSSLFYMRTVQSKVISVTCRWVSLYSRFSFTHLMARDGASLR